MSNVINTPSNQNTRNQSQYALQQFEQSSLVQQPFLQEAPIVYGNSNMHHYYQHPFNNHAMHSYPPQNILYTPSQMNYYAPPHHHPQSVMMTRSSPSSRSSSSGGSPRTPTASKTIQHSPTTGSLVTPLEVATTSPPPTTEERVKDTIARANAIPVEFFQTEFLEYSQKSYEVHQNAASKKRKRTVTDDSNQSFKIMHIEPSADDDDSEERINSNELRRQIHIQSEQKRRAQIKDGFDILKNHLPGCANKKMSKATLLTRTVQQLEHMKKMQSELLAEVERLAEENVKLKR
ncbi:unnamed protein product [Mucor hiemalis]